MKTYDSLEAAIKGCFQEDTKEIKREYVSGGDINEAVCLFLSNNERVFVKSNTLSNYAFFDAEEKGISAIASTKAIGVPHLLCKGIDKGRNISFLMMEMIEPSPKNPDHWERFGIELANMHKADTTQFVSEGTYGFSGDNYIGASKQSNSPKSSWIDFFREERLEIQIRMAQRYFDNDLMKKTVSFLDRLQDLITEPEFPSLIHGDLWSGNIMTDNNGKAILIDPAVYVGNAEADIAMTELFGRLPESFYKSYASVNPFCFGYEDRREIYNLYHLLNHLNLFGISYLYSVQKIISHYV